MSLEHDLAELSVGYHSMLATNLDLRERIQELETLVQDYRDFADTLSLPAIPRTNRDILQQRAKELLASE